jgi:hypothetical protein
VGRHAATAAHRPADGAGSRRSLVIGETVWRRADLPVGIHDRPVRPRRQRHTELANDSAVVKLPIFFKTSVAG